MRITCTTGNILVWVLQSENKLCWMIQKSLCNPFYNLKHYLLDKKYRSSHIFQFEKALVTLAFLRAVKEVLTCRKTMSIWGGHVQKAGRSGRMSFSIRSQTVPGTTGDTMVDSETLSKRKAEEEMMMKITLSWLYWW